MKKIALLVILSMALFCSCDEHPECDQERPYNSIKLTMYDSETDDTMLIKFKAISATATDSIFYDRNDSLHTYQVYLNPASDTVKYLFETIDLSDDKSLHISYKRTTKWLSADCGPAIEYNDLEVISTNFDSAIVISSVINSAINENIRIYN